jgi:hypothetical protein
MTDLLALSATLTEVALATPGVIAVYPTGSLAHTALRQVAALTSDVAADSARVAITRDSSGTLAISINIGVAVTHPVPDTLRAVADAIRIHLSATETSIAEPSVAEPSVAAPAIEVRASTIDTTV